MINEIDGLIHATHQYLKGGHLVFCTMLSVLNYVKHIFGVFGLNYHEEGETGGGTSVLESREQVLMPILDALNNFRNNVI